MYIFLNTLKLKSHRLKETIKSMPSISEDMLRIFHYLAVEGVSKDLTEEERQKIPSFEKFLENITITEDKIKIDKRKLPRAENSKTGYIYRKSSYLMADSRARCLARVRNDRYGGQCTKSCHETSKNSLCLRHEKNIIKNGYLYYGYITEKRYIRRSGSNSKTWKNTDEEEDNLIDVLRQ